MFPITIPTIGKKIDHLHPAANGLIGLYTFNGSYPGICHDHAYYRQKALVDTPDSSRIVWGKHDFAYEIVNVSDCLRVQNGYLDTPYAHPAIRLFREFTIAVWVKVDSSAVMPDGVQIFGCIDSALLNGYGLVLFNNEGGFNPGIIVSGSRFGMEQINSGVQMPVDEWIHLAVTYASGTTRFYVNGVRVADTFGSPIISYALPNQTFLNIGFDATETDYFIGKIESVWHYSRQLTDDEIQQLNDRPYAIFETHDRLVPLATPGSNTYTEVGSGGILGGGTAGVYKLALPTVEAAGVRSAGDAGVVKRNIPAVSGGAQAAGVATLTTTYQPAASGGVVANGTTGSNYTYNETMSGGTVGGGLGGVFVQRSLTATGGSLAAGAATNYKLAPNTATGGAVVGGSPFDGNIYNETMSGGTVGGGVALFNAVHNVIAHEGEFECGPFSSAFFTRCGPVVGGAAVRFTTLNFATAEGVRAAGIATQTEFYSFVVGEAGVVGGGIASAFTAFAWVASQGASCGGTAADTVAFANTATGGVVCAGDGVFSKISSEPVAAGISAGGAATVNYTSNPVYGGLSVKVNSSATDLLIIAPTAVAGGVVVAGTATVILVQSFEEPQGVLANSSCTVFAVYYIIGGFGEYNGAFSNDFAVIKTGVRLGGSAVETLSHVEPAAGGVVLNSSALESTSFAGYTVTGGAILSGVGTIAIQSAVSGGVVIAGTSAPVPYYNIAPTGGVVAAGVASLQRTYNITPTGGVIAAGEATVTQPTAAYVGDGIVVIGGDYHVTGLAFFHYTGTGTVVLGNDLIEDGGFECGAFDSSFDTSCVSMEADVRYGPSYSATGSITMGGTSQPSGASYNYLPRGKTILMGGPASYRKGQYTYEGNGTILISQGATQISATYKNRMCDGDSMPCVRPLPNKYLDCLKGQFFYRNCKKAAPDKCIYGAILPTITDCRQKGVLPLKNRRPPRAKR